MDDSTIEVLDALRSEGPIDRARVLSWMTQSDLEARAVETRNRIETGAVEHIFEEKGLRKYFEHWRRDPDLRTAYELCLAWGKAHSNTS